MKIVEYSKSLQWVGKFVCPNCSVETYGWRSSGMSQSFPHFYCDTCSNAFHFVKYQKELYYSKPTEEIVERISKELPECPCGGHFDVNAHPKCPSCGFVFENKNSVFDRIVDPMMIIIDGACLIRPEGESYQVKIIED